MLECVNTAPVVSMIRRMNTMRAVAAVEAIAREEGLRVLAWRDVPVEDGVSFLVLSDRETNAEMAPIPSLLATAAVYHHLLRRHTRTQVRTLFRWPTRQRTVRKPVIFLRHRASIVFPIKTVELSMSVKQRTFVIV